MFCLLGISSFRWSPFGSRKKHPTHAPIFRFQALVFGGVREFPHPNPLNCFRIYLVWAVPLSQVHSGPNDPPFSSESPNPCHNPGGDWHPGKRDNPNHIVAFWDLCLGGVAQLLVSGSCFGGSLDFGRISVCWSAWIREQENSPCTTKNHQRHRWQRANVVRIPSRVPRFRLERWAVTKTVVVCCI